MFTWFIKFLFGISSLSVSLSYLCGYFLLGLGITIIMPKFINSSNNTKAEYKRNNKFHSGGLSLGLAKGDGDVGLGKELGVVAIGMLLGTLGLLPKELVIPTGLPKELFPV